MTLRYLVGVALVLLSLAVEVGPAAAQSVTRSADGLVSVEGKGRRLGDLLRAPGSRP